MCVHSVCVHSVCVHSVCVHSRCVHSVCVHSVCVSLCVFTLCVFTLSVFTLCVFTLCFPAHSLRLVSVQSMLRQTGRFRTLDRDLLDVQERKLFEYFIVVALHKPKAGAPYLPEVTQQFPLKVRSQNHNTEAIPVHSHHFFLHSYFL